LEESKRGRSNQLFSCPNKTRYGLGRTIIGRSRKGKGWCRVLIKKKTRVRCKKQQRKTRTAQQGEREELELWSKHEGRSLLCKTSK